MSAGEWARWVTWMLFFVIVVPAAVGLVVALLVAALVAVWPA